MGVGTGWYQEFVGSNALLQATGAIEFPMEEFVDRGAVRYSHMDFEDSRLEAPTIALIQGCHLSTGKLSRCVLTCDYLKSCLGKSSQNSQFDIVDCCVTCKDVRVSASLASNNVLRAIRTDIVSARIDVGFDSPHPNTFRVEGGTVRTGTLNFGHTAKAAEARYEQVGGTLTATNSLVAGSYDSVHCGAMFKGVSLYSPLILFEDWTIESGLHPLQMFVGDGIVLRDFGHMTFRNFTVKSKRPFMVRGNAGTHIRDMRFENIKGTVAGKPFDVTHATIDFGQIDIGTGK